jgi:DNA-binding beta-propeller fold protein YncE
MFKKLLLATTLISYGVAIEATKVWESEAVLKVPESVLLDGKTKQLYVANINGNPTDKDGNGFITILNLDGTVKSLEFSKGFDAPKGMAIYDKKLYVSDISTLRVVDLKSGKIVHNYPLQEAEFLNDVVATKNGIVYVSDFSATNQAIYKLQNKKLTKWLNSEELFGERPNGLWIQNDKLIIGTKEGNIYEVNQKTKEITTFKENVGTNGIDGILSFDDGRYITSDWAGKVFVSSKSETTQIIDGTANKVNAADIWYDKTTKKLYIPTFFDNRILCYDVK